MSDFIATKLARLNPMSKAKRPLGDDEDYGEEIDDTSVAGGGHGGRRTDITQHQLRVSEAIKSFLAREGVLSDDDAAAGPDVNIPALQELLDKPHTRVPPELTDRSHPLPEYFISSSHNTYLMGHQLHGKSSAGAYETALNTGSRCVEIDAWDNDDNKDEPKVTHGYTLVSNIPFRAVCETIRDVVDAEAAQAANSQGYQAAPILLSLENHCGAQGQLRLVQIMKEVWVHRLLSKAVRDKGTQEQEQTGEQVLLSELESRICVIVEFHLPDEPESSDSSSSDSSSDEDEEKQARKAYKKRKKSATATVIIPELAELGVYAQSVKPRDNSWYEAVLKDAPHNHLINVSETGLAAHLPAASEKIARHNAVHMMRVFPKGTRISSQNLKPVLYWGVGAQICAMNWQTFGASMQLNEALFSGTDGFVLKPAALRAGGSGSLSLGIKRKLKLRIAGATDVPVPADHEADEIKPYVTCMLIHPATVSGEYPKRKTTAYKPHKLGFLRRGDNPPRTDPVWDETLEWEFEDNELVFVRILIKSDISFAANPIFAVAAVRLTYVTPGWNMIRMLDLKGRETKCTLLVKFDLEDV